MLIPPILPSLAKNSHSDPLNLSAVRQFFSQSDLVHESGFMYREISKRMYERLALVKLEPLYILDAGCGSGEDLYALRKNFSSASIIGLDISPPMLNKARNQSCVLRSSIKNFLKRYLLPHYNKDRLKIDLICGDFSQLPLAFNSIDLIWSNLALHWHSQPNLVLADWHRVLRDNGLLMFSCFGPDTFKELHSTLTGVDGCSYSSPFSDMHDLGDMLINMGFSTPVMDMEIINVTYETVEKMVTDVQSLGGNLLMKENSGPLSKNQLRDVLERNKTSNQKLSLTFEIIYGHAFYSASKTTKSGESIIHWNLEKTV